MTEKDLMIQDLQEENRKLKEKITRYEDLEEINDKVKDLVTIKISIYFEVKDSAVYGGEGSLGYAECSLYGNGLMTKTDLQKFVNGYKAYMAKLMKVPKECIRIISEEEYKQNTDDE